MPQLKTHLICLMILLNLIAHLLITMSLKIFCLPNMKPWNLMIEKTLSRFY